MVSTRGNTATKPVSAKMLRKNIIKAIYDAGSSHVGSALSLVEILNAVYSTINIEKIRYQANDRDRVILSKGHGVCALYAVLLAYGLITPEEFQSYGKNGSRFAGHATHNVKVVEHSTGALGHGVSVAVGAAYGLKQQGLKGRVYVIVGDGELHEGSNWEAFMLANTLKLDNLYILVDQNGLSGIASSECCDIGNLVQKLAAFGLVAAEVDGHSQSQITEALQRENSGKPTAIVCRTVKGKGVSFMEDQNVWHYRPISQADYDKAISEIDALGD